MKRLLVAEQWDQFSRKVLAPGVEAAQRREMRLAFYAGAEAILFRVIAAFAPDSEPTEEDLQIMAGIHQELMDFASAVKDGRA